MDKRLHSLKTINPYFNYVWNGEKTAELRKNDRDFQVGDEIWLDEWVLNVIDETGRYTGRHIKIEVTNITSHSDFPECLRQGWAMLSFKLLTKHVEDALL